MSELAWKWAYFPYLDAPDKQHESAVNAGYVKVVLKSEADKMISELKKEIESMKVKFREFNDIVCKKIVNSSRAMSEISQDAQMDFYEEFIKNEVNNG